MATGSLQLGGNLSVALGPMGRSAEASGSVNTKGRVAAMFSYSKSKGLYGGITLEGSVLVEREDANAKAYGRAGKNAKQILAGGVERPDWASGFIRTIDRFTLANTPSKDLDGEYFNTDDTSSFDNRGLGRSSGRRASLDSVDSRDLEDLTADTRRGYGTSNGSRPARSSRLEELPDKFDDMNFNDRDRDADRNRNFDSYDRRKSNDSWDEPDRRRKDNDYESRNYGSYAFGSPSSSVSNTPARVGSAASQQRRPSSIRQRSSSIASNLSFASLGRKKLDRSAPTPPPDWNDIPGQSKNSDTWGKGNSDGMDALDRELQGGGPRSPTAARNSPLRHNKSYSMSGGSSAAAGYGAGQTPDSRFRSGSVGGRGSSNTPVGWSQFSSNNDAEDDLFGDGAASPSSRDPFDELDPRVEPRYTGTSSAAGSYRDYANGGSSNGHGERRGSNPPSTKTNSSRFGKFRTPSPGNSAFGRKKTPTITEDEGDPHTSLISSSYDDYNSAPNGGGFGNGIGRRESFLVERERQHPCCRPCHCTV